MSESWQWSVTPSRGAISVRFLDDSWDASASGGRPCGCGSAMVSVRGSTSLGRAVQRHTVQQRLCASTRSLFETVPWNARCLPWVPRSTFGSFCCPFTMHSMACFNPASLPMCLGVCCLGWVSSRSRDLWPTLRHITSLAHPLPESDEAPCREELESRRRSRVLGTCLPLEICAVLDTCLSLEIGAVLGTCLPLEIGAVLD